MAVAYRSVQKVYQLSIFLENRVGLLLRISKLLEESRVHICAISVVDTADCAIIRIVVDHVPRAKEAFKAQGLTVYETPLIGVEVPVAQGIGITSILGILLRAEINIDYVYPLIGRAHDNPVLVFRVDSPEVAARILMRHDLTLVGQDDITWEEGPDSLF